MSRRMIVIRPAISADKPAILRIFSEVVRAGATFAFDPATDNAAAERIWFADGAHVYAAVVDGAVLGSCFLKPTQPGLGDHVANGGFMVAEAARGRGVGRALGDFAIQEARRLGFRAMQFNFVVASNTGAVTLWQDLGFEIIGTVPDAFRHARLGLTDIHIMYRRL